MALGSDGTEYLGFAGYDSATGTGSVDRTVVNVEATSYQLRGVSNAEYKADPITSSVLLDRSIGRPLYLGRHDKKVALPPHSDYSSSGGYTYMFIGRLFNEEDIGKPIPVWVSTEPPPY